jgi:hypothetical protein
MRAHDLRATGRRGRKCPGGFWQQEEEMNDELYKDLLMIVLEEAFSLSAADARLIVSARARLDDEDENALERAASIVRRIDSRCSKIEG